MALRCVVTTQPASPAAATSPSIVVVHGPTLITSPSVHLPAIFLRNFSPAFAISAPVVASASQLDGSIASVSALIALRHFCKAFRVFFWYSRPALPIAR